MAWAGLAAMAGGQILGGLEAQRDAKFMARQAEQMGKEAIATASSEAAEQYRQARLLQSRAIAVAAASGGSALDPDVVDIVAGIAREGDYRARTALYGGQTRRDSFDAQAKNYRRSGRSAVLGGLLGGAGTFLNSPTGMSLFDKYGDAPAIQATPFEDYTPVTPRAVR